MREVPDTKLSPYSSYVNWEVPGVGGARGHFVVGGQLGFAELRSAVRHKAAVDDNTQTDGERAPPWFGQVPAK